jgi:hypothetical protein
VPNHARLERPAVFASDFRQLFPIREENLSIRIRRSIPVVHSLSPQENPTMPMQLNIGDHRTAVTNPAFTFIAFPNTSIGSGGAILWQMRWARTKANEIAQRISSANTYFRSLPNRRSLSDILADSGLWVNYCSNRSEYGWTVPTPGGSVEVGICPLAFRWGRWTVLGTLIHELAHVNGAGSDHAAELALPNCGLGTWAEVTSQVDNRQTPYDPRING